MDNMGERIKEMLEKQNMSQKELAEKVGCTEAAISHYIKGDRVPRAIVVVEAMAALVIADALLCNMTSKVDSIIDFYKK